MSARGEATADLLEVTLALAVPLEVERLRALPFAEVQRLARESAQVVAEQGDVILYKSKRPGKSAEAFAALARGIACCAFAPGGVKFLGLSFEARHPEAPAP